MDQNLFKFDLIAEDPTTHARAGVLHTPHGDIETPIFMPVGTKANVKGIPTETVKKLGAQIVLANTYHLSMRPGEDTIAELGGLHKFMNWHGPILHRFGRFPGLQPQRCRQAHRRGRALYRQRLRRPPRVLDARGQHGNRHEARLRYLHAARPVPGLSRHARLRRARR